jgi:hypothetical protein
VSKLVVAGARGRCGRMAHRVAVGARRGGAAARAWQARGGCQAWRQVACACATPAADKPAARDACAAASCASQATHLICATIVSRRSMRLMSRSAAVWPAVISLRSRLVAAAAGLMRPGSGQWVVG